MSIQPFVAEIGGTAQITAAILLLQDTVTMFKPQMIDLVDADLTECGYVKLEAVFGSIDLLVSDRIHYRVKSENVFGNTRVEHHPEGSQDLAVDVSCVFGTINLRKVHVEDDILNGKYREK